MKQVDISLSGLYRLACGYIRKPALLAVFQESIKSALSHSSFLNRKQPQTDPDSFASTSWLRRAERLQIGRLTIIRWQTTGKVQGGMEAGVSCGRPEQLA